MSLRVARISGAMPRSAAIFCTIAPRRLSCPLSSGAGRACCVEVQGAAGQVRIRLAQFRQQRLAGIADGAGRHHVQRLDAGQVRGIARGERCQRLVGQDPLSRPVRPVGALLAPGGEPPRPRLHGDRLEVDAGRVAPRRSPGARRRARDRAARRCPPAPRPRGRSSARRRRSRSASSGRWATSLAAYCDLRRGQRTARPVGARLASCRVARRARLPPARRSRPGADGRAGPRRSACRRSARASAPKRSSKTSMSCLAACRIFRRAGRGDDAPQRRRVEVGEHVHAEDAGRASPTWMRQSFGR